MKTISAVRTSDVAEQAVRMLSFSQLFAYKNQSFQDLSFLFYIVFLMVIPQISAFPMGIPLFPYQTYQSFKRELRAQIAEGGSFENSSLLGKCILLAALVFTLLSMLLNSAQTAAWQVSRPLPSRNVLKLEKIGTFFFSSMNVCSIALAQQLLTG